MQRMLKVLQKNKKNIIINIVFIIIIAVFWWSTDIGDIKEYYVDRSDSANNYTFYVYGESQVFQKILCNTDGINELEIPIDTQKDRYRGEFKVTLADEDSNLIQEWNTDKGVLYSEKWIEYKLDEPLKKGETYNLIISATGLDLANAIEVTGTGTLNTANEDLNVSYLYCYYNGESDGCVAFAAVKYHPNVFAIIAVVLVMIVLNVFLYYDSKGADITKYSFISIFLLGLIMLVIFSPASGPDEDFHYNTSLALSNVLLGRDNISEVEQEYVFDYQRHINANSNFKEVYNKLFDFGKIDKSITVIGAKDRIGNLNYPSAHIIPAIGMAFGRCLQLNGVQVFTIARLFNLFFYALMAQIAIRLIPVKKELMYILAINPMALHQASQLTYDTITNGLCMVVIAYILYLAFKSTKVRWIDIIIIGIPILLFGPIKYIYNIYILLLLIIPKEKFKSNCDKVFKSATILVAMVVVVMIVNKYNVLSYELGNEVSTYVAAENAIELDDTSAQVITNVPTNYYMTEIIESPVASAKVWISTFNNNIWDYILGAVGITLGGMSVDIFGYIIFIYMLCVAAIMYGEIDDKYTKMNRMRLSLLIIACMGIVLVITAGFLMTPYGAINIQGIQGRYFVPCLVPLCYGMISNRIRINVNSKLIYQLVIFVYIGIIFSVMGQIRY